MGGRVVRVRISCNRRPLQGGRGDWGKISSTVGLQHKNGRPDLNAVWAADSSNPNLRHIVLDGSLIPPRRKERGFDADSPNYFGHLFNIAHRVCVCTIALLQYDFLQSSRPIVTYLYSKSIYLVFVILSNVDSTFR